jgi:hypothetical protein
VTLPATTLNGAVGIGASSLTVRDALGFPSSSASGPFRLLVDTEQLVVDAGHGTTGWALDGVTTAAHSDGAAATLIPEAYATIDDVRAAMSTSPTNERLARLADLLGVASAELTREVGHDFYRTPRVSGTQAVLVDSRGGSRLCVLGGFASLAGVRIADSFGSSTYASLSPSEWYVESLLDPAYSYDHILLGGLGTSGYTSWPSGVRRVELTVASGFSEVPPDVRNAVVDRVLQLDVATSSTAGGVQGPDEFGRPVILPRWPQTWWALVEKYRGRHGRAGCFL